MKLLTITAALLLTSCATVGDRVAIDAEHNSKARCEAATPAEKSVLRVRISDARKLYAKVNGEPSAALKAAMDEADRACSLV